MQKIIISEHTTLVQSAPVETFLLCQDCFEWQVNLLSQEIEFNRRLNIASALVVGNILVKLGVKISQSFNHEKFILILIMTFTSLLKEKALPLNILKG